jgi:hypothetical protein
MGVNFRRLFKGLWLTCEGAQVRRVYLVFLILPVSILSSTDFSEANDLGVEKSLQLSLEKSRAIIEKGKDKPTQGTSITPEITQLKAFSEEVKAFHLLLEDRFRIREEEIKAHGKKALERHRLMSEGYSRALRDYLALVESLSPGGRISSTTLDSLEALLSRILHKKKRPIFGSLPYKNLNYPPKEPNQDPPIKPAYKGGNKTVTPDDLRSTPEAPIAKGISELAQSLNWNPVLIYEWVKNNIETEWYWGCMKGAEETLSQRRGNDCDQAAVLVIYVEI